MADDDVRGEYASLLQDPDSPSRDKASHDDPPTLLQRTIRYSTLLIALCTLTDALLILVLLLRSPSAPHAPTPPLQLKSPYIGLAALYKPGGALYNTSHAAPPLVPIANHARALVQVSKREPRRVFPIYDLEQLRLTEYGRVPSDDQRVLVTPDISTIAQFRVLDFGMENCSLTLALPPHNATTSITSTTANTTINVYSLPLASNQPLLLHTLTHASLPRPRTYLGSFALTPSSPSSDEGGANEEARTFALPFACRSGTYHAFELACPDANSAAHTHNDGGACNLDFTGSAVDPVGVYVRQYQTI